MPPFTKAHLELYLSRYAEKEVSAIASTLAESGLGPWDFAISIPLCGEDDGVYKLFESLDRAAQESPHRVLAIVLINGRLDHPPNIHECNQALWKKEMGIGVSLKASPPTYFIDGKAVDRLVIQRSADGFFFGPKQGVGLARKLTVDLAAALFSKGLVRSPMLPTTDADVQVSKDYFRYLSSLDNSTGTHLFPFIHDVGTSHVALALYEISLRYYRLGLQYAGSPYAFHTLGSTLAIHAETYAKVRGFPDREAAEDFYLLNKLAKVGPVVPAGSTLHLTPRASSRVPFGTGAGTARIAKLLENGEPFTLYHPLSFEILKALLSAFQTIEVSEKPTDTLKPFELFLNERNLWKPIYPLLLERKIPETIDTAFRTRTRGSDRLRHLHTWFDSFQTLKWIHAVRNALPPRSWHDALISSVFLPRDIAPCPFTALETLRRIDLMHYGILWESPETSTINL